MYIASCLSHRLVTKCRFSYLLTAISNLQDEQYKKEVSANRVKATEGFTYLVTCMKWFNYSAAIPVTVSSNRTYTLYPYS